MKNLRSILFAVLLAGLTLPATGMADQTSDVLDDLFDRLKASTSAFEAAAIEGLIWKVWIHRGGRRGRSKHDVRHHRHGRRGFQGLAFLFRPGRVA